MRSAVSFVSWHSSRISEECTDLKNVYIRFYHKLSFREVFKKGDWDDFKI